MAPGVSDTLNLNMKEFSIITLCLWFYKKIVFPLSITTISCNQIITANDYLQSFQLLPYYRFSNTARLFAEAHIDHHFNGMLTNKIPLFRRLNWNLVGGTNAFVLSTKDSYVEVFAGLENLFKIARIDFVWGFTSGGQSAFNVRVGISESEDAIRLARIHRVVFRPNPV